MIELNLTNLEDLARGTAFLATGGGGDPYIGKLNLVIKIAARVPKIVDKVIVINAKPKLKRKADRNSSLLKKANIHLSEIPSGGNVKWSPELRPVKTTIKTGINRIAKAIPDPILTNVPNSLTSLIFALLMLFHRQF